MTPSRSHGREMVPRWCPCPWPRGKWRHMKCRDRGGAGKSQVVSGEQGTEAAGGHHTPWRKEVARGPCWDPPPAMWALPWGAYVTWACRRQRPRRAPLAGEHRTVWATVPQADVSRGLRCQVPSSSHSLRFTAKQTVSLRCGDRRALCGSHHGPKWSHALEESWGEQRTFGAD